mmetsp:Transcript_13395/g.36953  ORF Transcript_13395/g.36953 Transcript_13395/m.36953 type:complete len:241 (-) Transcript_13395:892-1614(-)
MLLFGFPTKSRNKIARNGHVGKPRHDLIQHQIEIGLSRISPLHSLEHTRRTGLGRHVQMIANIVSFGHEIQQGWRIILGMRTREANAQFGRQVRNLGDQIGKIESSLLPTPLAAGKARVGKCISSAIVVGRRREGGGRNVVVGIDILTEQRDFLEVLLLHESLNFVQNGLERTTPFLSARKRDNAKGTPIGATALNADKGGCVVVVVVAKIVILVLLLLLSKRSHIGIGFVQGQLDIYGL